MSNTTLFSVFICIFFLVTSCETKKGKIVLKQNESYNTFGTWQKPDYSGVYYLINESENEIKQFVIKQISTYSSSHNGNDVRLDTIIAYPKEEVPLAAEVLINGQGLHDSILNILVLEEKIIDPSDQSHINKYKYKYKSNVNYNAIKHEETTNNKSEIPNEISFSIDSLAKLYDGILNAEGYIVWKQTPDFAIFGASSDGLCYTKREYEFTFKTPYTDYKIIILNTYEKGLDGEFFAGHGMAPITSMLLYHKYKGVKNENTSIDWTLRIFDKHATLNGQWGQSFPYEVVLFGDDYLIKSTGGEMHMGEVSQYVRFYHHDDVDQNFNEILSVTTHEDNEGSVGKDKCYFNDTKITLQPDSKTIKLHRKGTIWNPIPPHNNLKVDEVEEYILDGYELKAKPISLLK